MSEVHNAFRWMANAIRKGKLVMPKWLAVNEGPNRRSKRRQASGPVRRATQRAAIGASLDAALASK